MQDNGDDDDDGDDDAADDDVEDDDIEDESLGSHSKKIICCATCETQALGLKNVKATKHESSSKPTQLKLSEYEVLL